MKNIPKISNMGQSASWCSSSLLPDCHEIVITMFRLGVDKLSVCLWQYKTKGQTSECIGREYVSGWFPPQFKKCCMSCYSSNLSFRKSMPFQIVFLI